MRRTSCRLVTLRGALQFNDVQTGIYVDDVDAEFRRLALQGGLLGGGLGIAALLTGVADRLRNEVDGFLDSIRAA